MRIPFLRALRFARHWTTSGGSIETREVRIAAATESPDTREVEATVYLPRGADPASLPGWILLHGITRPGRFHPALVSFATSMAASGAVVVVPEVPEWVGLRLAPDRTGGAVRAAMRWLADEAGNPGPWGLMGFSFGSPQAVRIALDPDFADDLATVAAFGGYGDLERTLRFLLTGRHETPEGVVQLPPDPYGRWIVVGNWLTEVPGFEERGRVAEALLSLASTAGDLQIESSDPRIDPTKRKIRAELEGEDRTLFDWFAPPAAEEPIAPSDEVERWIRRLAEAARRVDPTVEPVFGEPGRVPVHIVHGEKDQLIPWSEAARLKARLGETPGSLTITRLFAHSKSEGGGWLRGAVEQWRFLRLLDRILGEVG